MPHSVHLICYQVFTSRFCILFSSFPKWRLLYYHTYNIIAGSTQAQITGSGLGCGWDGSNLIWSNHKPYYPPTHLDKYDGDRIEENLENKIGLLLCHSHIELRLWLRLSWGWGWNEVEMRFSGGLVDIALRLSWVEFYVYLCSRTTFVFYVAFDFI